MQRSPRASQESGPLSPSSQRFLEHEVSTAWGVNSVNAREPSLSQLVVIAHDSRLIILLFISHSLRASRIPSKRGNLHADTRSGIDASWLACRWADYAPRLRFSPRMAQESSVSSPPRSLLFAYDKTLNVAFLAVDERP